MSDLVDTSMTGTAISSVAMLVGCDTADDPGIMGLVWREMRPKDLEVDAALQVAVQECMQLTTDRN